MPEISSIKLNAERANASPAVGGVSSVTKSALDAASPDRTNQQGNSSGQPNKTDRFAPNEKNISDYTKLLQSTKDSSQKKETETSEVPDSENELSGASGSESDENNSEITSESLTGEEKKQVDELKSGDKKVKSHEAAHAAVGGDLVRGKSFDYAVGPDGRRYAVGGEVQIDISPVANDPQATIQKMQQIRRAALAPSDPSPQDRSVASTAQSIESQAQAEITSQIGKNDTKLQGLAKSLDPQTAAKAYTKDSGEEDANGAIFDSINTPNDVKNLTGTSGSLSE